jgi:hypothetical protein
MINLKAIYRACKFARDGIPAHCNLKGFALVSGKSPRIAVSSVMPQCKVFPQFVLFDRAINRLPTPCRPRMTAREKFNTASHCEATARCQFVLSLPHLNKGGTKWTFP